MTPIEARIYPSATEGVRTLPSISSSALTEASRMVEGTLPPLSLALSEYHRRISQGEWVGEARIIPYGKIFREEFKALLEDPSDSDIPVYNPSADFINPPNTYEAVRIDSPHTDVTKTVFIRKNQGGFELHPGRTYDLEDPVVNSIGNGELLFSGIRVHRTGGRVTWEQVFHTGKSISEFEELFQGPEGMKDIRTALQKRGKQHGWYTRPRKATKDGFDESYGGRGTIGYTQTNTVAEVAKYPSLLDINHAPPLIRAPSNEWVGVNNVRVVEEAGKHFGWNEVLAHRATRDENGSLHYYPWMFLHDPETGKIIDLGLLDERPDLPKGPTKRKETEGVLFAVEYRPIDLFRGHLKYGISDAQTGGRIISNPHLRAA